MYVDKRQSINSILIGVSFEVDESKEFLPNLNNPLIP